MPEQAPNIDVKPGDKGRLVYDKARRTIVAELPVVMDRCPYCAGDESKCDFSFQTEGCSQMNQPMTFNNGLSPEHDDAIDDIMIDLMRINQRIEGLGRHRSYSLAVTKIEEAAQWMRDRKHKAA